MGNDQFLPRPTATDSQDIVSVKVKMFRALANAHEALNEADTLEKIIHVKNASEAIEIYARQKSLSEDIVAKARGLISTALAKLGKFIDDLPKFDPTATGRVKAAMSDRGVNSHDFSRAKRLFAIQQKSPEQFERYRSGEIHATKVLTDSTARIQFPVVKVTRTEKEALLKFVVELNQATKSLKAAAENIKTCRVKRLIHLHTKTLTICKELADLSKRTTQALNESLEEDAHPFRRGPLPKRLRKRNRE